MNTPKLDSRSIQLRREVIKTIENSRRGHVGSALSIIEILRVLYEDVLRIDPARPHWKERDRFILSKGHGCLALYVILADMGYFSKDELYTFCGPDSFLGGHPEYGKIPGVEASTGALGHGLSIGVGIAINGMYDKGDYRTFVLVGDGECNEGSIWEAAMCASKHRLDHLVVLVDYNKMQCYSTTYEVQDLEPFADKWLSFGFGVREVDGHDVSALRESLISIPYQQDCPSLIICHTVKGKGVRFMENNATWHHKSRISDEEVARLYNELETVV